MSTGMSMGTGVSLGVGMGAGTRVGVGSGMTAAFGVGRGVRFGLVLCAVVVLGLVLLVGSAGAVVVGSAGWSVSSVAEPSTFSVADNAACAPARLTQNLTCDEYEVVAVNSGRVGSSGEVVLKDRVPAGLEVQEARLFLTGVEIEFGEKDCVVVGQEVSCGFPEAQEGRVTRLVPDAELRLVVVVKVASGAKFEGVCPAGLGAATGCVENVARVEGGGAPVAAVTAEPLSRANLVNGPDPSFGFSSFGFEAFGVDGAVDSTAGDHPFGLSTTVFLNSVMRHTSGAGLEAADVKDTRDVVVDLPLGFAGSVLAAPQCTFAELSSQIGEGFGGCPTDTIVGHIKTEPVALASENGPIYNMVPERGMPAEFAFVDLIAGPHVIYSRIAPTPAGYVLQAVSSQVPQVPLRMVSVQFYGIPAEHDETTNLPVPFFTNPTACSGEAPGARIYMDSWQNPARLDGEGMPVDLGEPEWVKAESKSPPVTGCNALSFSGELQSQLTTQVADAPSGMNYELSVPQPEQFGVPATPAVAKIVTRLPQGLTGDPSSANGLEACSEAQIGWEPAAPGPMRFNAVAPECPEASKIGSLELESPLTASKLEGEVFLAAQNQNPFSSTFAVYVVVHDPATGVLVKIAGKLAADAHSGQLTALFEENPELPFSDLKLHFFEGPRAQLATPQKCGSFTSESELTPFSSPDSGGPLSLLAGFGLSEGCPSGFSPSVLGGSENLQAGAYTPFVTSFGRSDSDQEFQGVSVTLPSGVLAKLGGVTLCTNTQIHEAEAGTGGCPASSFLGSVSTGAGPGPDPYFVSGKAYLTGPYNGGSYGIAVVVPAVAGPYDFGTVVVRQALRIDPHTARVTDVSDPLPKIIDGVPLRVRRVDLAVERPEFTFNPTSCEKLELAGNITGSPQESPTSLQGTIGYSTLTGEIAAFKVPFQVTSCNTLAFKPTIHVETKGQASKANGQSLRFKISYPKNSLGRQSWLGETKFDIPKQLPSRLETIQQACTVETFETNRAACPVHSIIGHAVVHTQALPEPLEGPLYFVSYANKKFPETVLVLKGDNVTIEQHGETFINHKTGVTSATFHTIPDAPVESIEVTLPTGPFSEFGANLPAKDRYNFCNQKLTLPTLLKAQNNQTIHQNTPITTTGCKHKHTKHKTKHHTHKKHK